MTKSTPMTEFASGGPQFTAASPDLANNSDTQPFNHSLLALMEQATRSAAWALDAATGHLSVSPQLPQLLAWPAEFTPAESDGGVLAAALAFYAPASRSRMAQLLTACLDRGVPFDAQVTLVTANDQTLLARTMGQPVRDASGVVAGVQGLLQLLDAPVQQAAARSNTSPQKSSPALKQLLLLQASVAKLGDMVVITEVAPPTTAGVPDQRIVFVNNAFERRTGYTLTDVLGRNPRLLQGKQSQPHELARIRAALQTGMAVRSELINYTKGGVPYWAELEITPVGDAGHPATHWVAVARDISDRKAAEDEIEGLAFYDALTELPNRKMLMVRLERALAFTEIDVDTLDEDRQTTPPQASADITSAPPEPPEFPAFIDTVPMDGTPPPIAVLNQRQPTVPPPRQNISALMFIDLDHFKILNDTLGHATGDLLLQKVALRLASCVRLNDTVARLGGDEFVVMLENLGSQDEGTADDGAADSNSATSHQQRSPSDEVDMLEDASPQRRLAKLSAEEKARAVGQKIVTALSEPFDLAGHQHHCTCSVGITVFGRQPVSLSDVLKQADLAMYQAKNEGRNGLCFFDPAMQALAISNAALNSDLRRGLRDGEFELYYQPQVGRAGRMFGVEALLRWQHPERGLVAPDNFIPQAEESGLIMPLGEWALRTACAQLAAWGKRPETQHLSIAVNVSMRQFRHPEFVDQVLGIIAQTGIRAHCLKLELTESLLATGLEVTIAKMGRLKAVGVTLSIDDFGMGYSALSYLKYMPLDQLKIDRSFVKDVLTDPNDAAIARTIIGLAQSLGLSVVAEGVETEEQRAFLAKHGCESYQGWLFCKALPIDKLEAFMQVIWHAELLV